VRVTPLRTAPNVLRNAVLVKRPQVGRPPRFGSDLQRQEGHIEAAPLWPLAHVDRCSHWTPRFRCGQNPSQVGSALLPYFCWMISILPPLTRGLGRTGDSPSGCGFLNPEN